MSVRTAASACSREGRGSIGAGAARTCSDKPCFGHGFTLVFFASMTGRSVRPVRKGTGCVTGLAASVRRSGPFAGPFGRLDAAFPLVAPRALLAAPHQPLYIHLRRRGKPPDQNIEKTAMLNEVYNARILELAGNIPR